MATIHVQETSAAKPANAKYGDIVILKSGGIYVVDNLERLVQLTSTRGFNMEGGINMGGNIIVEASRVSSTKMEVGDGFYTSQGKFGQNGIGIQGSWQNTYFAALNFGGSGYVPVVGSNIPGSSRRYKKNIKPLPLETAYKILDAVAVEFDWKKDSGYKGRSISFIAEDIAEIDPRYVYKANYVVREAVTHVDPETGETVMDSPAEYAERVEGLTQNAIIAAQHEVIKDHDRKISEQKKLIDNLTARIDALEAKQHDPT